jgi:DNA-binding MarR family transcriptional regulator
MLMGKTGLIQSEKQVLYGLVRFPLLNDRELAEKLDMKLPTLTAIRHRLERMDFYRQVRVPFLFSHGAEMFASAAFTYNASVLREEHARAIESRLRAQPEIFWAARESGQDLALYLSSSFTDLRQNIEGLEEMYVKSRAAQEAGQNVGVFPYRLGRCFSIFEFAPMLRQSLGIEGFEQDDTPKKLAEIPPVKLTRTERQVLLGLVRDPDVTDKTLSEKTGISRYTIAKAKEKFESSGILRTVRIPNFTKLGFEMLVYAHGRFNLQAEEKDRLAHLGEVEEVKAPFLFVYGATEAVSLDLYHDFEEYRKTVNQLSSIYQEHPIFVREPHRILYSVREMKVLRDCDFVPFVEKVLKRLESSEGDEEEEDKEK